MMILFISSLFFLNVKIIIISYLFIRIFIKFSQSATSLPYDINRTRSNSWIFAHDGHTRCEWTVNTEHDRLSARGQHGQLKIKRTVIPSKQHITSHTLILSINV